MGMNTPLSEQARETPPTLAGDERWQLVKRIIESRGFERASQLRKILLYVSRSAIPNRIIREYDIACDVLDRRKDFDPGTDNIVRSQFTHLRRKLEHYFLDEGKGEALTVKIPKGSYLPQFAPIKLLAVPRGSVAELPEREPDQAEPIPAFPLSHPPAVGRPWWRDHLLLVAALCLLPSVPLSYLLLRANRSKQPAVEAQRPGNAFV